MQSNGYPQASNSSSPEPVTMGRYVTKNNGEVADRIKGPNQSTDFKIVRLFWVSSVSPV